jgi:hypothetical protein
MNSMEDITYMDLSVHALSPPWLWLCQLLHTPAITRSFIYPKKHYICEIFALLGCYATYICSRLLTFQENLWAPSSRVKYSIIYSTHTHSVELPWKRNRPVAEISTWQYMTHKKLTSEPPAGFEPTIPASERPWTHDSDRAAARTSCSRLNRLKICDKTCFW